MHKAVRRGNVKKRILSQTFAMEETPESTAPHETPREPSPRRRAPHNTGLAGPPLFLRTKPFLIGLSIWAAGFALAFALSWKTNTNWDRGIFAKLSYGLGAGVHSWSYLLLWLMYIWGRHNPGSFVPKVPVVLPIVVS